MSETATTNPAVTTPAVPAQAAGIGATAVPAVSGAPQPSAAAAEGQALDLTQLEPFRKVQSEWDKRDAQRQAEIAALQNQIAAFQQRQAQSELERLDDLDKDEQNVVLRRMVNEHQQKAAEEARFRQLTQQAMSIVAEAGLDWNDPRLNPAKSIGATPDGVIAIAAAAARLKAEEADAAKLAALKAAEDAAAKAKVEADRARIANAAASGVAATSVAPSQAPAGSERDQQIAQFKQRFGSLRGKGVDSPAYTQFLRDMRQAGVTFTDLGY